ncbi:MAG: hypothetical protein A2Z20_08445 [Bdellovibrionales bacterium RBG_16_40_8]|nr:MAG: hypothetical protein A2Z20_08445 [Bdellovibrionales bacterium RBG_16_40_8]
MLEFFVAYIAIGFLIGALGTFIGIGGGVFLVPLILFLYPALPPSQVTAVSLFCVTLNAFSGSVIYAKNKQIHYLSGILFALASLPGVWLGVSLTTTIEREKFITFYAVLLFLLGSYLLLKKTKAASAEKAKFTLEKKAITKGGVTSFFVGIFSGFFGVGGGIIYVPFLHQALNFPVHLSAGTSHFILVITSVMAVVEHIYMGAPVLYEPFVIYLAIGIIIGAQLGGRMSKRAQGVTILRVLAIAILIMAVRMFFVSAK